MSASPSRRLEILSPGLLSYEEGLRLQRQLAEERAVGARPDTLILLEHPPTITLGRSARGENVLYPVEMLSSRGVDIHHCDRGGDVTFHGPGQLVAYPIVSLEGSRCSVRGYMRDLEEVMIRCCKDHGVAAGRKPGMIGAWIGGDDPADPWRKIGAAGVHISRWITTHGLALNVSVDLDYFSLINPCGITEHPITSLAAELKPAHPPSLREVSERLIEHFSEIFGVEPSA
ncbi:MAG: lipoyl(octanoyl) transferase LipB [Myxococcota bacterium]